MVLRGFLGNGRLSIFPEDEYPSSKGQDTFPGKGCDEIFKQSVHVFDNGYGYIENESQINFEVFKIEDGKCLTL